MINSAEEFIHLREENDPRATYDEASTKTWGDIINRYPEMKSWVIHNKTVPISILRLMISDPDPSIRADIATKRKLNEDMFIKLAFDDNENVRRRLLYNKKTPVHVLKVLTDDPNKDISEYAAKRIAELQNNVEKKGICQIIMAKEAEKQKFCNSMKYIIEIEDKDSDTCDNLLPTILKCFNEEQSRKFNS